MGVAPIILSSPLPRATGKPVSTGGPGAGGSAEDAALPRTDDAAVVREDGAQWVDGTTAAGVVFVTGGAGAGMAGFDGGETEKVEGSVAGATGKDVEGALPPAAAAVAIPWVFFL
jgi:hypothetical protein